MTVPLAARAQPFSILHSFLRDFCDYLVTKVKIYSSKLSQVVVFLFSALTSVSQVMAEKTIDFSKGTNLKAVYDAGLRPWRGRPDEMRNLFLTEEQIRIIAPNGKSFSMSLEIGDLSVLAENQLNTANFISHPASVDEALKLAKDVSRSLGIDVGQGDAVGSIDQKASEFSSLGNRTPVPQYWNGSSEINGIRYNVVFRPLFGYNETRAKVSVTLDFHQRDKPRQPLTESIKPPLGYEHISMDPPKTNPTRSFPNPEYSFEIMDERAEAAKTAEGRSATRADASSLTPAAATSKSPRADQFAPWPWIISASILFVVVGGILLKFLRKSG